MLIENEFLLEKENTLIIAYEQVERIYKSYSVLCSRVLIKFNEVINIVLPYAVPNILEKNKIFTLLLQHEEEVKEKYMKLGIRNKIMRDHSTTVTIDCTKQYVSTNQNLNTSLRELLKYFEGELYPDQLLSDLVSVIKLQDRKDKEEFYKYGKLYAVESQHEHSV